MQGFQGRLLGEEPSLVNREIMLMEEKKKMRNQEWGT